MRKLSEAPPLPFFAFCTGEVSNVGKRRARDRKPSETMPVTRGTTYAAFALDVHSV